MDFTAGARYFGSGVFKLAFDPMKSSHYKVVLIGGSTDEIYCQIYTSKTGKWSLCTGMFTAVLLKHFKSATYWNDGFHWLEGSNRELTHCELNIKDNEHPTRSSCQIRHGLHMGKKFLELFGGPISGPVLFHIKIPFMLHLESKFLVSCGCLSLVFREDIDSTKFNIYEMMNGAFAWSVKYNVNIGLLMDQIPEKWSIRVCVWSIYLGKGEVDAFVVINLSEKVIKYNLIIKTYIEMVQAVDDDDDDDNDDEDNPDF